MSNDHLNNHSVHHHGHLHHEHSSENSSELKLFFSILLNFIISLTEILGGIFSGSLSLISDSLHNLNDTFALFISYISKKISKKPKDNKRTYGYKRFEVIGAFLNTVFLTLVACFLV